LTAAWALWRLRVLMTASTPAVEVIPPVAELPG